MYSIKLYGKEFCITGSFNQDLLLDFQREILQILAKYACMTNSNSLHTDKHNKKNMVITKGTPGINDNDDVKMMTESLESQSMIADSGAGQSTDVSSMHTFHSSLQSNKSAQKPSIETTTVASRDYKLTSTNDDDHELPHVPHNLAQDRQCEFTIDPRNFVGTWEKHKVVHDERNCDNSNSLRDAIYQIRFQTIVGNPVYQVFQVQFIQPKQFIDVNKCQVRCENNWYNCTNIYTNTMQQLHFMVMFCLLFEKMKMNMF